MSTWIEHDKTGNFPDGGCYNDQPAALLNDWDTLDRRYGDIVEHLQADEHYTPPTLEAFIDIAPVENTAPPDRTAKPHQGGLLGRLRGGTKSMNGLN